MLDIEEIKVDQDDVVLEFKDSFAVRIFGCPDVIINNSFVLFLEHEYEGEEFILFDFVEGSNIIRHEFVHCDDLYPYEIDKLNNKMFVINNFTKMAVNINFSKTETA